MSWDWYPGKMIDKLTGGDTMRKNFGVTRQQQFQNTPDPDNPMYGVQHVSEQSPAEGGQDMLTLAYDSSTTQNPEGGRQFSSQDFDVTDKAQVENLQQILLNEGYNIGGADGMFGPKTEAAYRDFINKGRMAEGADAYSYEGPMGPVQQGGTPLPMQTGPATFTSEWNVKGGDRPKNRQY